MVLVAILALLWCWAVGFNIAVAHAEEPLAQVHHATGGGTSVLDPMAYLLQAGPIGALVWGAYTLGKGVKFTIVVELSETDRALFKARGRVAPAGSDPK